MPPFGHNVMFMGEKAWVYTMIDKAALLLVIVGALNWGLIGLLQFDAVAWLFGGQAGLISRVVYTLVAVAGVWCISLLFKHIEQSGEIT